MVALEHGVIVVVSHQLDTDVEDTSAAVDRTRGHLIADKELVVLVLIIGATELVVLVLELELALELVMIIAAVEVRQALVGKGGHKVLVIVVVEKMVGKVAGKVDSLKHLARRKRGYLWLPYRRPEVCCVNYEGSESNGLNNSIRAK